MRVNVYLWVSLLALLYPGDCLAQNNAGDPQNRRGYISSAALPLDDSASDRYPHVTTLEKAILGQTYVSQPLPQRLGRMEVKAFGKASLDPDLGQRTDNLEDYAQKTLHQKPFGAGSAADVEEQENSPSAMTNGGAGAAGGASASAGTADACGEATVTAPTPEYPHITNLEKEILGQTFPGQPLPDRLVRMETKAFGKASTVDDYSERTDALEAYAQKKLHAKPFIQQQAAAAGASGGGGSSGGAGGGGGQSGASSTQSKILSMVGNSLLSMAGVGRLGVAGPMGMMGGNPAFGQGMGGGLIPGFGGVRARPRQQETQAQPTQQEPHPDDPAVNAADPPPATAKMLTKVGWCEVQLFGHTSSNLHLPDRLKQLNQELNYAPGKSPIDLMDDVSGLIKAVQARKKANP